MFQLIIEGAENNISYTVFQSIVDKVITDKRIADYNIITSDRKIMDEYAIQYASENNKTYTIIQSDKTAGASAYLNRNAEIIQAVDDINQSYAIIGMNGKDIDTKHLKKLLDKKHISYEVINF